MDEDAVEMVNARLEPAPRVVPRISQPLDWPVKIRCRRIREKKMPESLRDQPPRPDERITLDQRRIIPDVPVPERWRIGRERRRHDEENEKSPLFQSPQSCERRRKPAMLIH